MTINVQDTQVLAIMGYVQRVHANSGWYNATPQDLAHRLLGDAEFRSIQLGTWLGTVDGELVRQAVVAALSPWDGVLVTTVADALILAADEQKNQVTRRVLRGLFVGAAAALFAPVLLKHR